MTRMEPGGYSKSWFSRGVSLGGRVTGTFGGTRETPIPGRGREDELLRAMGG